MSLENLDRAKLKLILKTSEAFPTQFSHSQAKVIDGKLSPSRFGHPLSQHLRGAQLRVDQSTGGKTKFCSLDDMAEALELVLKTPEGMSALRQLQPGIRKRVSPYVDRTFDIEGEFDSNPPRKIKFTRVDLAIAGFTRMKCCAVLEGRARDSEVHLHVQTFFPELNEIEMMRLLKAKRI